MNPTYADWQPIETAPGNQKVLLYCPWRHGSNPERVEIDYAMHGRYYPNGDHAQGTWSHHAWATYWAPLPQFPITIEQLDRKDGALFCERVQFNKKD